MDEKGNPASQPAQPRITLFGKSMNMLEGGEAAGKKTPAGAARNSAAAPDATREYDDREERRIFWTVAATFAVVFAVVFAGMYLVRRSRNTAAPGSPPAAATKAVAAPAPTPAPPSSAQPPETIPPATGEAPSAAPPAAAPQPSPPAKPAVAAMPSAEQPKSASRQRGRRSRTPKAAAAQRRQSPRQAAPAPAAAAAKPKREPVSNAYLERLKAEKEQYEREKAAGKYREFPK